MTETDTEHASSTESTSLVGQVVDGRYRVERQVGEGGFGAVFAAWHIPLDTRVAFKVLKVASDVSADERAELVGRFLDEARLLTRLKHPHIVSALDLGTVSIAPDKPPTPYIVMEWCPGATLKAVLAEGRMSLREAFEITDRLAGALAHAHAMGVAHRDLKPSNVIMVGDKESRLPRLVDFGIAKLSDPGVTTTSGATLTTAATRAFTPAYAAPEQVAGARTGPWTDVHALGLLFIEMVTGDPPYAKGSCEAREARDAAGPDGNLAVIDQRRPTADRDGIETGSFGPVIARAVALRPPERFADAAAMRAPLREAARAQFGDIAIEEDQPVAVTKSAPPPRDAASAPPAPLGDRTERTAMSISTPGADGPSGQLAFDTTKPATVLDAPAGSPAPRRSSRALVLAGGAFAVLAVASVVGYAVRPATRTTPKSARAAVPAASLEPSAGPSGEAAAPAASADGAAASGSGTFCELSDEEKKARFRATGLRGYGWNPGQDQAQVLTSIRMENGAWLTVGAHDLSITYAAKDEAARAKGAKTLLSRASEALDLLEGRGIAYAMRGSCFVYVRGPSLGAANLLGAMLRDLPTDLRGDTFGGPAPLAFPVIGSPKWDGTKANSVRTLTEGELLARIRAENIQIDDTMRSGNGLQVSITHRGVRGTIMYDKDPAVSSQVGSFTRGATSVSPFYTALDGDVLVVAFGGKEAIEEKLLDRLLSGLAPRIVKTP